MSLYVKGDEKRPDQSVRSNWTADYLIGCYIEAGATGTCVVNTGKIAEASNARYYSIEEGGTNEILNKVGLKVS